MIKFVKDILPREKAYEFFGGVCDFVEHSPQEIEEKGLQVVAGSFDMVEKGGKKVGDVGGEVWLIVEFRPSTKEDRWEGELWVPCGGGFYKKLRLGITYENPGNWFEIVGRAWCLFQDLEKARAAASMVVAAIKKSSSELREGYDTLNSRLSKIEKVFEAVRGLLKLLVS